MGIASREPRGDELEQAMALRRRVFCDEQGVDPAAEFDGLDDECRHLVAIELFDDRINPVPGETGQEAVVGTCRLRELERGTVKLERMAIELAARGSGAGRALCEAADGLAAEMGARRIVLHAQRQAEGFYATCGYVASGDTFIEEGIPHVLMERNLNGARHPLDLNGARRPLDSSADG